MGHAQPFLLPTFLVIACTAACATGEFPDIPEPKLGAKADLSDDVPIQGDLEWGATAEGRFESDLQFQAYTFTAAPGAHVSLRIDDAEIEPTLFLFGPATNSGSGPMLEKDIDVTEASPGDALITTQLPAEGLYTIAIGTSDGAGRGSFALSLICNNDACEAGTGEAQLTQVPTPDGLSVTIDAINDGCDDFCYAKVFALESATGRVTPRAVSDALARDFMDRFVANEGIEFHGDLSSETFAEILREDLRIEGLEEFASLADVDPAGQWTIGESYAYSECGPSVECSSSIYIVIGPDDIIHVLEYGHTSE
jgi:hypothetical protein